eukprot:2669533-Alexandrium_andersonii.AAC.1
MCIRDRSAQGPSVLQSASIRHLPCRNSKIASGVRTWNCAGPRAASVSYTHLTLPTICSV